MNQGNVPYGRPSPYNSWPNGPGVPPSPAPRPPTSNSTTALSVLWALVPLFTCGIGTPFIIGYAAAKRRSTGLIIATGGYALGILLFFIAIPFSDEETTTLLDVLMTLGLFANWVGGLGHALLIRASVFSPANNSANATNTTWPPAYRPPAAMPHTSAPIAPGFGSPISSIPPYPTAHQTPGATPLRPSSPVAPQPWSTPSSSIPPLPSHPPLSSHPSVPPATPPRHAGPHTGFPQTGQALPNPATWGGAGNDARFTAWSAASPTSQHNRPGHPEWLGPYRVVGDLGRGGQGWVYLALTPEGQKVAIKVLLDHVAEDQVAQSRFLREVEAARRVAPFSTARVLDVNFNDRQAYVVSEYVDGPSLERLIREKGPHTADGLTRLALATSGALAAIHKAGIVHRDFKPSNVLIGSDGPRVIDFGIAKALDQVTATASNVIGTPAYMSPEQLGTGQVGPKSDMFSWGATMIFAASARPAFGDDTIPAVLNRVLNHHPDLSVLPPGLRSVVASCLEKDQDNRPTASDAMLAIVQ